MTTTKKERPNFKPQDLPGELPILPLRNRVLLPGAVMPITVGMAKAIRLMEVVVREDSLLGIITQKTPDMDDPTHEDLYNVGTIARIIKIARTGKDGFNIIVEGIARFSLDTITQVEPFFTAKVTALLDEGTDDIEVEVLADNLKATARKVIDMVPEIPVMAKPLLESINAPGHLADLVSAYVGATIEEKQKILETLHLKVRLKRAMDLLSRKLEVIELSKTADEPSAHQALNVEAATKRDIVTVGVGGDATTIAEALTLVTPNGKLHLLAGEHECSVTLLTDVTIEPAAPNIDVTVFSVNGPVFTINGGNAMLHDVTVEQRLLPEGTDEVGEKKLDSDEKVKQEEKPLEAVIAWSAIVVWSGGPRLERLKISSRSAHGVVAVGTEARPIVSHCAIEHCGLSGLVWTDGAAGLVMNSFSGGNRKQGMDVRRGSNPTVQACNFYESIESGIAVAENGLGTFENCESYRNKYAGISVKTGGNPTVHGCTFYDANAGMIIEKKGVGTFDNCDSSRSLYGIVVDTGGNPTVRHCRFHESSHGGIFICRDGLGTFENCESFRNTLSGITVYSGGNPTARNCKFFESVDSAGIVVSNNGLGTFEHCESYRNRGCGILMSKGGNPTLRACDFYESVDGAGIVVSDNGLGTFENCKSHRNRGCGIMVSEGGDPTLRACNFYESVEAPGIAVFGNGLGTFESCQIFRNKRVGILVSEGGNPTLRACKFYESIDESGIAVLRNGLGTFENCESLRNKGFGIAVSHGGNPTVRTCKFYESVDSAGIFVTDGGLGTFESCESYRNTRSGIEVKEGGNPTVRTCRFYESVESAGISVFDYGLGAFENCESYRNTCSGIEVKEGGNPTVRTCKFYESVESAGISVFDYGLGAFENCESYRNTRSGIEVKDGGNPTVRGCKFYESVESAGIVVSPNGLGTFDNCESYSNKLSAPTPPERREGSQVLPYELPILTIRTNVLFPGAVMPLVIGQAKAIRLIERVIAGAGECVLGIVTQKDPESDDPDPKDLFGIGTVARIIKLARKGKDGFNIVVEGLARFRLDTITGEEPYFTAKVTTLLDEGTGDAEVEALSVNLKTTAQMLPDMPAMMKQVLGSINAPGHLADVVAASIDATIEEKQTILETVHLKVRLQRVLMLLSLVRRTREIHEEVDAATRTHPELNPTVVLEYMRHHRTTVKAAVEALLAQQTGGDPLVGRWLRVNGQRVAWHEAITLTNDGGKSLLIVGPPGSRPEYAAQLLCHPDDQLRAVVVVPCAGLAASLLEREIFGFAPVSRSERDLESFGLLQEVGQGALVLQDIDALTPPLQERVLRLMHARSYLQVGGVQRQRFSGRIVATTRRDLGRLVTAGKFRAELYARLATLTVELLALQERRDDIPHAVRALLKKRGAASTLLPAADLDALQRRDWPMDLDELEEHLVRSVVAPAVLVR